MSCNIFYVFLGNILEAERYSNIHLNFNKKLVSAQLRNRKLTFQEWVFQAFLVFYIKKMILILCF